MARQDKHLIKNLYYMLAYAFQTLREVGYKSLAVEDFDNIHDLFAAILIKGIATEVKRGLHRDYINRTEVIAGLRGQILISETVKQQTQAGGRLVCSYDDFAQDTLHNQVLKSAILLLLRHGNVRIEDKKALRKLLLYFADVSDMAPQTIRWDALKYHRNNASYRMLIGICELLIKGLLLTNEDGGYKLANWIQEEKMFLLYQRFVLNYYKVEHSDLSASAAYVDWDIGEGARSQYLPVMKTDITLKKGDRTLIIDTKYYRQTMQYNKMFDSRTYISNNLYQIYTYVKNSDVSASGKVAGVLLYARTDEEITPDEDTIIGGNRISVKTLDLNRNWMEIRSQLDGLCEWLNHV